MKKKKPVTEVNHFFDGLINDWTEPRKKSNNHEDMSLENLKQKNRKKITK